MYLGAPRPRLTCKTKLGALCYALAYRSIGWLAGWLAGWQAPRYRRSSSDAESGWPGVPCRQQRNSIVSSGGGEACV